MKQFLINPFARIAGGKALVWGLIFITATTVLERLSLNLRHLYLNAEVTETTRKAFTAVLAGDIVNLLVVALMLYAAGVLISKSRAGIRPIDVLGTTAFANIALLPIYILMVLPPFCRALWGIKDSNPQDLSSLDMFAIMFFGLVGIASAIWYIKFLYRAFCISCNVSGAKAVLAFVGALAAAVGLMSLLPEFKW